MIKINKELKKKTLNHSNKKKDIIKSLQKYQMQKNRMLKSV